MMIFHTTEAKCQDTEEPQRKESSHLTWKFRQDTTTSPFGVIIGTFSQTMPLSTSITSPEETKE